MNRKYLSVVGVNDNGHLQLEKLEDIKEIPEYVKMLFELTGVVKEADDLGEWGETILKAVPHQRGQHFMVYNDEVIYLVEDYITQTITDIVKHVMKYNGKGFKLALINAKSFLKESIEEPSVSTDFRKRD